MALQVSVGLVNYYIPAVSRKYERHEKKSPEDQVRQRAAWAVPAGLHGLATRLDGSNWYFNTANYPEVKKIADEFEAKGGIEFYIHEEIQSKNPEVIERIVRTSLQRSMSAIAPSLRQSIADLIAKFDEINLEEADGKIVDIVRENKAKLKNASAVVASFALTGDYQDLQESTAQVIESELVRARVILGKKQLELLKQAESTEAKS